MEPLLNTRATADVLGVTPEALRVWRHRGQGPVAIKYGRQVMYRRADIEAWLESCVINRPLQASA